MQKGRFITGPFSFKVRPMTDHKGAPLLVAGLGCRCPRCGRGPLFAGYLTIAPACSVCGLSFANSDTADGPAYFIMMPLCILTAVSALLVELKFEPPVWLHMVIWPTFILGIIALALRPVKATLVALQYRYRNVEQEE
jgi:uncharacterized protein (DUF983 family)